MPDIHPSASLGFSRAANRYARGRPDFPAQALEWLRDDLHLVAGKSVVDLGAGTGKFTRRLLETGAAVIAVEPVAAMLAQLRRDLPSVTFLEGRAQEIPLPDACLDAVVCAQSFHWFASVDSLAEIRRVLKPEGMLGLIWNVRDQSVEWMAQLTHIMAPYEGDAPRYDAGEWRRVFPAAGFGALRERTFAHWHVGPPDQVIVDRIASVSFIAALDDATRERVLDEVRALIATTPALAGRSEVAMPYFTRAYCASAS